VFSQTQDGSSLNKQLPAKPTISHSLFQVSIRPLDSADDESVAEEGDQLDIGDFVRTGEDSIARIYFPDGTTETLCENTIYEVEESGSEFYDEDDDPNLRENIIDAFSRCDIRPRFITRCRDEGSFIRRTPKAGERGKIGQEIKSSNSFAVMFSSQNWFQSQLLSKKQF